MKSHATYKARSSAKGVTFARGFSAAGVHVGLKRSRKDLALIASDEPCVTAGVFTTNKVIAPPVVLTKKRVAKNPIRAVIVNSGNANVCTGEQGMEDAVRMAELTADSLGLAPDDVGVASTGVIGVPLPMDKIERGIPRVARELNRDGDEDAAEAILTTDTMTKQTAVAVHVGDRTIHIGGMAKGSGMIHPNMATMLAFITTDAPVERPFLQETLKDAVDTSFNLISVDGDTSTNDMVLLLANGMAGGDIIKSGTRAGTAFRDAVTEVCIELAKMIAADGEGATKLVEIAVTGATGVDSARTAVRAITRSPLVKTAIHGEDANWGRILCAVGYSGARFDPNKTSIYLGDLKVCERGAGIPFDEGEASRILSGDAVRITVDLGEGASSAVGWTCDLSADYVRINGGYRT